MKMATLTLAMKTGTTIMSSIVCRRRTRLIPQ